MAKKLACTDCGYMQASRTSATQSRSKKRAWCSSHSCVVDQHKEKTTSPLRNNDAWLRIRIPSSSHETESCHDKHHYEWRAPRVHKNNSCSWERAKSNRGTQSMSGMYLTHAHTRYEAGRMIDTRCGRRKSIRVRATASAGVSNTK